MGDRFKEEWFREQFWHVNRLWRDWGLIFSEAILSEGKMGKKAGLELNILVKISEGVRSEE